MTFLKRFSYSHLIIPKENKMKSLVLDKKKYVVVAQKEYDKLIEKAAAKTPSARKMSLLQAKKICLQTY